jgi:hypothetical protein
MPDPIVILRFVRDNTTLLIFVVFVTIAGGAWIMLEAFRSHKNREEVHRLRSKLSELGQDRASIPRPTFTDPVVLSSRWIRSGGAATTTDGGCLLYVNKVSATSRFADLTVRIDGYAVLENHSVGVGERLEANGKYGTYILELSAVEGVLANVAVALRNRHKEIQGS